MIELEKSGTIQNERKIGLRRVKTEEIEKNKKLTEKKNESGEKKEKLLSISRETGKVREKTEKVLKGEKEITSLQFLKHRQAFVQKTGSGEKEGGGLVKKARYNTPVTTPVPPIWRRLGGTNDKTE